MRKGKLLLLIALLLLSCGRDYREVLTLKKGKIEVSLRVRGGVLKKGENDVLLVVKGGELKSFYLYMPPMGTMPPMRSTFSLKRREGNKYYGSLKVEMNGAWQVFIKVDGSTLSRSVVLPLKGGLEVKGEQKSEGGILRLQNFGVVSYKVKRRRLLKEYTFFGQVLPAQDQIYQITVRFSGWVLDTFSTYEGMLVKKGQRLLKVLSPEVEVAKKELKIAKEMGNEELINSAREKLRYLKSKGLVLSPVEGVILKKETEEGGYVREGQVIYEIAPLNRVWVVFYAPPSLKVKRGEEVLIEPEGVPKVLKGKVDYVFPTSDRSRTQRVRVVVHNERNLLFFGQLVKVVLVKDYGKVLAVPKSAVIDTGKRTYVYIDLGDGTYALREVLLGKEGEDFYEVLRGLKEGERVVLKGNFLIDAEARLRGLLK